MFRSLLLSTVIMALGASLAIAGDETTRIASTIPFQDEKKIQEKVLVECAEIGEKLSRFISTYSDKKGVDVQIVPNLPDVKSGERFLKIEIVNAISQGNLIIGHSKFVEVEGTLYEEGEIIGSFYGTRSSGGGFFGGYKGSCAVLGRCVKTLGKDIAAWLKDPRLDSRIGE